MSDGTSERLWGAEREECGMRNVDTQGRDRRNRSPEVSCQWGVSDHGLQDLRSTPHLSTQSAKVI